MHLKSQLSKQIHPRTLTTDVTPDPIRRDAVPRSLPSPKSMQTSPLQFKLRTLAACLLASSLLVASPAYALTVQPIRVLSSLGEPFRAEIVISDIAGVKPDTIRASLANDDEFVQLGINKLGMTRHLHFSTKLTSPERGVISISSDRPLIDPYIEFVVHIGFGNNTRLQQITALVDPPLTRVQTSTLDLPVQRIELAESSSTAPAPAPAPETPILGTVTVTRGVITTPAPVNTRLKASRRAPPPMDMPSNASAPLASSNNTTPLDDKPNAAAVAPSAPIAAPVTPKPAPAAPTPIAPKPAPVEPAPAAIAPKPAPVEPAPAPIAPKPAPVEPAPVAVAPTPISSPIAPTPIPPAEPAPTTTPLTKDSVDSSVAPPPNIPSPPSMSTPAPMDAVPSAPEPTAVTPVEPTKPAEPVVAAKPDADHAYTVRRHDSLWSIAARMQNTSKQPIPVIMQSIKQMNKSAFIAGNSNHIRSGAVLILPTDQLDEPAPTHADQPIHIENEDLDRNKAPTLKQPNAPINSSKGMYTSRGRLPDAKLTLVAPTDQGSSQGAAATGQGAADDKKLNELNLQISTSRQKNLTLGQEVGQLEAQIKANDQKIALQNARLAELMQRLKNRKEAAPNTVKRIATS